MNYSAVKGDGAYTLFSNGSAKNKQTQVYMFLYRKIKQTW